jgi:hypothetical protein
MTVADRVSGSRDELVAALLDEGYVGLFMRSDESAAEKIWNRAGSPDRLHDLALHSAGPSLARFLAAEVLFVKDLEFPPAQARELLAGLYAQALAGGFTVMANPWGLPGALDGPVVVHLLSLGDAVLQPLSHLLDDDAELSYSGSKEATVGNSFGFRVKDLAATVICATLGLPFQSTRDRTSRDALIAQLRQRLT